MNESIKSTPAGEASRDGRRPVVCHRANPCRADGPPRHFVTRKKLNGTILVTVAPHAAERRTQQPGHRRNFFLGRAPQSNLAKSSSSQPPAALGQSPPPSLRYFVRMKLRSLHIQAALPFAEPTSSIYSLTFWPREGHLHRLGNCAGLHVDRRQLTDYQVSIPSKHVSQFVCRRVEDSRRD